MAEAEAYCDFCQLPLFMCWHGKRRGLPAVRSAVVAEVDWDHLEELAEQAEHEDSKPFPAAWGGLCHGCGDRWEPGDMIAWAADDGELVHASCVS